MIAAEWSGRVVGVNRRLMTTRRGHIYAFAPYKGFREGLAWCVAAAAGGQRFDGPVAVRIVFTVDWRRDIDRGVCAVRIRGKGQKERQVKVRRELVDRVRAAFRGKAFLFERPGGGPYSRQHVSREVHVAGQVVLKRRISAHTLRHTFATLQIRKTHKVKGVSLYLGHSSTAITQDMYVHEELDLKDLALNLGARRRG